METEEPVLGDGEFSPRLLRNAEEMHQWNEDHNPYLGGTYEHGMWKARFYMDQSSAVSDPKRSTNARINQVLLRVQIVLAAIAVIIIAADIWIHTHG